MYEVFGHAPEFVEGRWYGQYFKDSTAYVSVGGEYVRSTDMPFYQVSGCTMAPMRTLAEALGLSFSYDAAAETASCSGEGVEISVKLGSTTAVENGVERTHLGVPAQMVKGRFCVPVRFMAEAAGLESGWDAYTSTIWIAAPQAVASE